MLEECGVDRHHVFEMAVDGTILDHQDLAVALDDHGFNFAGAGVQQVRKGALVVQDLLADFRNALRTEGVGLARPA